MQLRGCTVEPDLGFGYDILPNALSFADWCKRHPCINEYELPHEAVLATGIRCRMMLEVVQGLLCLKSNNIVHGNVTANTVFIQQLEDGRVFVRVSDYGLVRPK